LFSGLANKRKTPEQSQVAQKAEAIEEQLQGFRQRSDMKLRFARGLVETCREWNPRRERYEELKKRARAVEKALQVGVVSPQLARSLHGG
jgi:hypothetical protein